MKSILFFAFILLIHLGVSAKSPKEITNEEVVGLYLSLSDFKQGNLIQPVDKQHEEDKIKLKQFFVSPYIMAIENGKESVFYKDSIFAIKLENGDVYRFINLVPCLIADTSFLFIYEYKTTKTEERHSGPRTLRKEVPVTYYYFSVGNHKAVFKLNLQNITKYAITDTSLHKVICNKFISDDMLSKVDEISGIFEVNKVLQSFKKH